MTEKEFIIALAVNAFNAQYHGHLKLTECDAKKIPNNTLSHHAYEIFTDRLDDFVRLRIYLEYGKWDRVGRYSLENDYTFHHGELDDEVFVASGSINKEWVESGQYKFGDMRADANRTQVILLENNTELLLENGQFIHTE